MSSRGKTTQSTKGSTKAKQQQQTPLGTQTALTKQPTSGGKEKTPERKPAASTVLRTTNPPTGASSSSSSSSSFHPAQSTPLHSAPPRSQQQQQQQEVALARYRENRLLESYLSLEEEYTAINTHLIDYSIVPERDNLRAIDHTVEYDIDLVNSDDLVSMKNAVRRAEKLKKKNVQQEEKNNQIDSTTTTTNSFTSPPHPPLSSPPHTNIDPLFDDSSSDSENSDTGHDTDPYEGLSQIEIVEMMMAGVGLHPPPPPTEESRDNKVKKQSLKVPLKDKARQLPIDIKMSMMNGGEGAVVMMRGNDDDDNDDDDEEAKLPTSTKPLPAPQQPPTTSPSSSSPHHPTLSSNPPQPPKPRILKLDLSDILGKEDLDKIKIIDQNLVARRMTKTNTTNHHTPAQTTMTTINTTLNKQNNPKPIISLTDEDDFDTTFPTVP